jgi:hypothetical protein
MLFFLALSCVDYDFTEWELVDVFHQAAVEELDLLIVMDNSASMEPYQAQLGQHFNAFISYFDVADVDYHIALITTDTVRSDRGIFLGEVIDPETPDPEAAFSTMINVGSGGSGTEMGLEAARLALTEPLASTENVGFLRPDAFKTVVIVSDEDDASPDPVHVYVNDLVAASGGGRMDFNASTVTVTDVDSCDEDKHLSHAGTRYIAAVDETGGVSGNICDTDSTLPSAIRFRMTVLFTGSSRSLSRSTLLNVKPSFSPSRGMVSRVPSRLCPIAKSGPTIKDFILNWLESLSRNRSEDS